MKINGWDIAGAGAMQWNVAPGFHSISNNSEWTRGSPVPVFLKNTAGFKPLKITLLIKADSDRQIILNRCSEILSHLLEPVELELDDFGYKFYGVLTKHSLEENPLGIPWVKYNRASKLILEFNGFEFAEADSIEASGETEITVNNIGNIMTPAVVEITPQIAIDSVTLTGICYSNTGEDLPIVVRGLETGKTIILDGETGLFTQEGEIKTDLEIWNTPALLPGSNTITVDNQWMNIVVRYRPRFM